MSSSTNEQASAFVREPGMTSETATLRGDAENGTTKALPKNGFPKVDSEGGPDAASERSSSRPQSESYSDVLIVDWDGPDDPENPRK